VVVETGKEALAKILKLIPAGASVMNGSSRTLEEIGFLEYLKSGKHGWRNQHELILSEKDPLKQVSQRKQALLADYYLGSAHAVTEDGELIIASASGSQLSHLVFSSPNVILVVGTQKIVNNREEAMKRLDTHVIPLEDERMKQKYGFGTSLDKILIFRKENPMLGRKVTVILVKEKLGF
jgi:hypothetical protein